MTRCCYLQTSLFALVLAGTAFGQVFLPPPAAVGGAGFRYVRVTPNSALSISLGSRFFGAGPMCGPGFGFNPYAAPWAVNSFNQTTVIVNPPLADPLTGWPTYPRGFLVDPLAVEILPAGFLGRHAGFDGPLGNREMDRFVERIRDQLPVPLPDPNRGLPEREEDRIQVRIDRRPAPPPVVRNDAPPLFVPVRAALPVPAEENPQAEYLRLVTVGKDAFGRGEYGRARERFTAAITVLPGEGPAWFLRSQAAVALGKFHDAARDLREGLKRFADGLVAGFNPNDVYGANAGDYPEHRAALELARQRFPGDVDLALVAAVQLWLAGDRVESVVRMEKLPAPERQLVEPFVQAARRQAQR